MITTHDVRRKDSSILLGIAVEAAVLDIVTSDAQLEDCVKLLEGPHSGLVSTRMGTFGTYPVTLNLHHDGRVSIFIDGPQFEQCREQCSAIWLGKDELRRLLVEVVQGKGAEAK